MVKTPETMFTNPEIAGAFSIAAEAAGIVLPDGNGLKIVGKSDESTWSKNPLSFETDDAAKTKGPHTGNWVLWTPSVDTWGKWNLVEDEGDENSALLRVVGGALRPFARAANSSVRGTTTISSKFQAQREDLKARLAHCVRNPEDYHIIGGSWAENLVLASLPDSYLTDETVARLTEQGSVFLQKVVDIGVSACNTLLESES